MSEAVADDLSPVEAVILSGPRRGQIIHINLDQQETLSDEDMGLLAEALRGLDAAVVGLLEETKSLKQTIREAAEDIARA